MQKISTQFSIENKETRNSIASLETLPYSLNDHLHSCIFKYGLIILI